MTTTPLPSDWRIFPGPEGFGPVTIVQGEYASEGEADSVIEVLATDEHGEDRSLEVARLIRNTLDNQSETTEVGYYAGLVMDVIDQINSAEIDPGGPEVGTLLAVYEFLTEYVAAHIKPQAGP